MKVLHAIHSLDPRSGGPSNSLRGLVAAQARRGDDVAIITTSIQSGEPWDDADVYRERIVSESCFQNVEVKMFDAYGRHRPWSRFAFSPGCRRELRSRMSDAIRCPDVVHIHGLFSHLTSSAAHHARKSGIPYVLRPAGGLDPWCLAAKRPVAKSLLLWLLVRTDLERAATLHAMSPDESEVLRKFAKVDTVACIPHGVDMPEELESCREEFLTRFPQLRGRRCLLFMGRLHAKKRPDLLVAALSRLRPDFPDVMLILAGSDDGLESMLRRQVSDLNLNDAVVFTGFLSGRMKSGAFHASEVFALPSQDENFGLGVIEAMAHGVAPLVTRGVGAHEHVDHAECGVTVGDGLDEIVAGLRSLLQSDCHKMGERGAAYVRIHLSWESVAERLAHLYAACQTPSALCANPC